MNAAPLPIPRRIQKGKNAGIAKILIGSGPGHAGMGILVDPFHVITCAHVVNVALGRDLEATEPPERQEVMVSVAFPMIADAGAAAATVERWQAPGGRPQDDIALLRLSKPAPEEAGIAILADVTGMATDDDALSVFGMPAGDALGNHIDAKFKGSTTASWIQIDGLSQRTPFIMPGFSGGAVWDAVHSAVLGMIVAKKVSEAQRVAYMIPTVELRAFWDILPVEERRQPESFARTWTVFSAVVFFLLLAHWAADRGTQAFFPVTLSGVHRQLAAFYGMHLFAVLAPLLFLLLIVHAKAFRLHDWVARVPSFGALGGRPASSRTWRTAALSLVAFVLLPIAAQVHFLNQFHDKGYVYVYPGSFGFQSDDELERLGQTCFKGRSLHLCTKADAGRYRLAEPNPGSKAGYWDNAYHFGDLSGDEKAGSLTFFPILQPIVILLLTALSLILAGRAVYLVCRPTPAERMRAASKASESDR